MAGAGQSATLRASTNEDAARREAALLTRTVSQMAKRVDGLRGQADVGGLTTDIRAVVTFANFRGGAPLAYAESTCVTFRSRNLRNLRGFRSKEGRHQTNAATRQGVEPFDLWPRSGFGRASATG